MGGPSVSRPSHTTRPLFHHQYISLLYARDGQAGQYISHGQHGRFGSPSDRLGVNDSRSPRARATSPLIITQSVARPHTHCENILFFLFSNPIFHRARTFGSGCRNHPPVSRYATVLIGIATRTCITRGLYCLGPYQEGNSIKKS